MAVSDPELFNDYWVYMRDMIHPPWGSVHLNPTEYQTHNAYRMRAALQAQGYDEHAIAGIIGNAQVESGITTGAIEKWSVLPNSGESIADVPNSYMLQYYTKQQGVSGYGLGLLQWDRYSRTYQSHDLLGWCNANGYDWYDGAGQMARLDFEFQNNAQYNFWRMNYGSLTWADYKQIETTYPSYDPGECANVWASCWELSSLSPTGRQQRRENAQYWYDWFQAHPTEPKPLPVWLLFNFRKERRGTHVRKTI
jgi:hypothetical protein